MMNLCSQCRHFSNSPAEIEEAFPGLNILSSAYGSVRADAGICSLHDLFLTPRHQCADFEDESTFKM